MQNKSQQFLVPAIALLIGVALGRLIWPAPSAAQAGVEGQPRVAAPADSTAFESARPTRHPNRAAQETANGAAEADQPARKAMRPEIGADLADPVDDPLWTELQALLDSESFRDQLLGDSSRLRSFQLARYFEFKRYDAAWALLESGESPASDWGRLADQLRQVDPQRALAAYQRGIDTKLRELATRAEGHGRHDRSFLIRQLERMLALDPSRALATLEGIEAADPSLLNLDPLERAKYLFLAGRGDQASPILDEALLHPYRRIEALESLDRLDDAAAEAYLRRFLELNGEDPAVEAALASTLAAQERFDEATALIDGVLESADDVALLALGDAFGALPDDVLAANIDRWVAAADPNQLGPTGVELLGNALDFYESQGDPEAAIAVQAQILNALASGSGSPDWLPRIADHLAASHGMQLVPSIRAAESGAGVNDELWGDLGDLYWSIGLQQDAERCWQTASKLDPSDGEWTGNLGSLFDGQDPH
ncbi:MAG: hypothetical protein AAFZ65_08975 [Planctomycetota bacterium]